MKYAFVCGLLLLHGCVAPSEEEAFRDVEDLAASHVGPRVRWIRDTGEPPAVGEEARLLLAGPLSVDAAVQIALLENRRLQEAYEHLGIARADLVQAGLLGNPVFAASARYPDRPPSAANLDLSVVQDFLGVLLLSARKHIAEVQLEEAKLTVGAQIVELAAEVRAAYFTALGAAQVASLRGLIVEAARSSAELAGRLHEEGNLSDLQMANELGLYESARVALARADAERLVAREQLTRLMGLWGAEAVAWTLPTGLPDLPAEEVGLGDLEARAVATRLDLAAARKESEALARALGVTRDWRLLMTAEVGVGAERDTDGQWVAGPELSLELPLFDRGQARIARLAAELRRADHRVLATAVQVRSDVREMRTRVVAMRRLAEHYRSVVIPVREAAVTFTQQEYSFMLAGAFQLIAAKQAEYDAYHDYVEVVRDYWIARSELERAVGASLGPYPGVPGDAPTAGPENVHGGGSEHPPQHRSRRL